MNRITEAQATESPAGPADGELLSRFLADRDDQAFAELVARHGLMVYGVCLRRLGRSQDAEDCFQAVFLALATHGQKLTPRQNVGPWLYTVARQVAAKAVRSRSCRRWVFWGSTPEPAVQERGEVDVELDAALASLSEPERSAVVLCHLEGLSRAEAAKALAIPEGTLSARLSRALEKLRRKLGRQPLAVLAAATVVMLPDSLSASTMGLVRHWKAGTLEDWASPRVLDLYRKALPMRLLDRFGPAFAALAAAVLIMFGAAAGWQLVKGQGAGEGKEPGTPLALSSGKAIQKKRFATAVEEMQATKSPPRTSSAVQLKIASPMEGLRQQPKNFPWSISVLESIGGAQIFHTPQSWQALNPLLKQIADDGVKEIEVDLDPQFVGRLEANQVFNICKRAGFASIDYRGPKPFLGDKEDALKSFAKDAPQAVFHADLTQGAGDLPDWTNGWWSDGMVIHYMTPQTQASISKVSFDAIGGARGPAANLLAGFGRQMGNEARPPASELANRLDAALRNGNHGASVQITGSLGGKTYVMLRQGFGDGEVVSFVEVGAGSDRLLSRVGKQSADCIDVTVGDNPRASENLLWINPLQVNRILNACKRDNVRKVRYVGQKLFTGENSPASYVQGNAIRDKSLVVEMNLDFEHLEGDLPDDANGWVLVNEPLAVGNPNKSWVVKASERQQFLDSQALSTLKSTSPGAEKEVLRLAKLSSEELEKELLKKSGPLRSLFRKAVDIEKAKKK